MSVKRAGEFLEEKPRKKPRIQRQENPADKLSTLLAEEETLAAGLIYFWKEITEHSDNDLLTSYLYSHPDCSHVLVLLELSTKVYDQDNVLLCFLLLEHILLFAITDSKGIQAEFSRSIGSRLAKALLDNHLNSINYSLSSNKPDILTAAALRVLTMIVMQEKSLAIEVLEKFDFSSNRLNDLPNRNKVFTEGNDTVRVCYIKLAIAFLVYGSSKITRKILPLKKFMSAMFHNLHTDPCDVQQLFLSTLSEKVISQPRITKKDKLFLFDKHNIKCLVQLGCGHCVDESIRDVVFNVLHELACWLCFKQSSYTLQNISKTNNPALLNLALCLISHLDQAPVTNLISSIVAQCPDLLLPFLNSVSLSLDPKPTQKWLSHATLLHTILTEFSAISEIFASLLDVESCLSMSVEPFVALVCPHVLTRTIMSNGIQSYCLVVKEMSLKLVHAVLGRFTAIRELIKAKVTNDLTWRMFCDSIYKCLPDVQVLMNARHFAIQVVNGGDIPAFTIPPEELDIAVRNEGLLCSPVLLNNVSLVLYRYQSLVPTLLAQSHINVAKLLTDVISTKSISQEKISVDEVLETHSSTLSATFNMIMESPVESLQNILKVDFIQCLLYLLKGGALNSVIIDVLVKCLQVIPCLMDYENDLLIMCNVIVHHLHKLSLYSNQEIEELMDFVTQCLTEITGRSSFYWFGVFELQQDHSQVEDEIGGHHFEEQMNNSTAGVLCPLLAVFIDHCSRSPTVPKVLLVIDLILKLVHTSNDPVGAAAHILHKLQKTGSFLHYKENRSVQRYVKLLHSHLWMWSSSEKKEDILSFDKEESREIAIETESTDPSVVREQVFLQLSEVSSTRGLVDILSNEKWCPVALDLLETLPLSFCLANLRQKQLKKFSHTVLWRQCLCCTASSKSLKSVFRMHLAQSSIQTALTRKWFNSTVLSDRYHFGLVCHQLMSALCLLPFKSRRKSVRQVISFCLCSFLQLIINYMSKNSSFTSLAVSSLRQVLQAKGLTDYVNDSNIVNSIVSLCVSLPTLDYCCDEVLISLLTTNTCSEGSSQCDQIRDVVLPVSLHLESKAKTHPHLKYSQPLFHRFCSFCCKAVHVSPSKAGFLDKELSLKVLKYCTHLPVESVSKLKLLTILLDYVALDVVQSSLGSVLHVSSSWDLETCVEFIVFVKAVLAMYKRQVEYGSCKAGLSHFISNISSMFKRIILETSIQIKDVTDSTDAMSDLNSLCCEAIELCVSVYPTVKLQLNRLLYQVLIKKSKLNFHFEFIGFLFSVIGVEDIYFWLTAIKCLLRELLKVLKKDTSPKADSSNRYYLLLDALHKTLKSGPVTSTSYGSAATAYSETVTQWNKFVLKAIRQLSDHSQTVELLADLATLFYPTRVESVIAVSVDSIFKEVWSLHTLKNALNAAQIRLLVTIADHVTPSLFTGDHMTTLLGSYAATLSCHDVGILYLISLYEREGVAVSKYSPLMWGPKAFELYELREEKSWLLWRQPTVEEVLSLVSEKMLLSSIDSFPYDRLLEPISPYQEQVNEENVDVYDPCFLIPLLNSLLQPSLVVNTLSFIRRGFLSYIIAATSSNCEDMRRAAYHCLSCFNEHLMAAAEFSEKQHLIVFMELLRNSVIESNARLPVIISSLFAKAGQLLVYPERSLFPVIANHLVEKPFVSVKDIPLYNVLLQSPKAEERVWMIELLIDGLKCDTDYHLYRKHAVLSHLMTLYQSPLLDDKSKLLIMKLLTSAISSNSSAMQDCSWNLNLLSWIHSLTPQDGTSDELVSLLLLVSGLCIGETEELTAAGATPVAVKGKSPPFIEEDVALTSLHLLEIMINQ